MDRGKGYALSFALLFALCDCAPYRICRTFETGCHSTQPGVYCESPSLIRTETSGLQVETKSDGTVSGSFQRAGGHDSASLKYFIERPFKYTQVLPLLKMNCSRTPRARAPFIDVVPNT